MSTLVICEKLDEIRRKIFVTPSALNELDTSTNWTPLMTAIFYNKPTIARFLIARGADLTPMSYSRSALTFAFNHMPDIVFDILTESARIVECGSKADIDKMERFLRHGEDKYRGHCVNTKSNLK